MPKPLDHYPHLKSFLDKHKIALENKSKDVRFTMTEFNNVVADIHEMMLSVASKQEDNSELKKLMQDLLDELKQLTGEPADGGRF